jgi:diphthamide synthase subunit DPH2
MVRSEEVFIEILKAFQKCSARVITGCGKNPTDDLGG